MKLVAAAFKASQAQSRAALITHLTAGYPSVDETPEIMLAMQAGGAGTYPPASNAHSY